MGEPIRLADMAWVDVYEYLQKRRALLIPIGTCEQHGPHLPLATDLIVAERLAEALSARTQVLVAPPINYGVNLAADYLVAGTAGVDLDCLRTMLRQVVREWAAQGFDTFFAVTAHACSLGAESFAHETAIREALSSCMLEVKCRAYLLFPYWISCADLLTHETNAEHASEMETSLLLHLWPSSVHLERVADGSGAAPEEEEEELPAAYAVMHHMPSLDLPTPEAYESYEGTPQAGTAEKGRLIFARWVDQLSVLMGELMAEIR
ncbi:MAG TPA: creatininase family protein [Armatimonadota bacterium]|nr:creatininase family protein [Armatimonadota bacterium]